jgi:ketopantoate hydroxymethyltransferase
MSKSPETRRVSVVDLQRMREQGRPITMCTAYDYPTQSAALANLRAIQSLLHGKGGNAETVAHTRHVLFTIDRALEID